MKQEKWRKIERKELDREWEEEHVLTIFFIYQSIYWFVFQVFHHNAIQFVVNIRIKFCPFYVSLLTLWRESTNYLENKKNISKYFSHVPFPFNSSHRNFPNFYLIFCIMAFLLYILSKVHY